MGEAEVWLLLIDLPGTFGRDGLLIEGIVEWRQSVRRHRIIIVGVRRSYIHVSREGIVTHVHVHVHPRLANALHLLPAKRQETNNNNKTN